MRRTSQALSTLVLLAAVTACGPGQRTTDLAARTMPAGPLAPRERMAAAWAGSQLYVVGGAGGTKDHLVNIGDGAAFDPASGRWQPLPPDAVAGRRGLGAVARGDEILLWGGERNCGRDVCPSERSGAVLDTRRRTWRDFDPGPAVRGMSDPQLVAACGNVFATGGDSGSGKAHEPQVVLGAWSGSGWRAVPLAAAAYDIVATADTVYVATADVRRRIVLQVLDACTGERLRTVPTPDLGATGGLWLEVVDGRLHLARSTPDDEVVVQALSELDEWHDVARLRLDDMAMPHPLDGSTEGWSGVAGRTVYGVSSTGLWTFDARTGRVGRIATTARTCAAGAVAALSPRYLLLWGGQTCTGHGAPQTAEGLLVPLTTPGS